MVRAFAFAVENYDRLIGEMGDVFNVGNEAMNYTKEQVALKIRDRVDFWLHFADVGSDPDKRDYMVSNEKIEATGYRPMQSLEAGIRELIKACAMVGKSEFRNL